jgi:hypothetical protein
MRQSFIAFLFVLFTVQAASQSSLVEVSGPVSGIWDSDTVLVTGDIVVQSGDQLEVAPGTLVLFEGHFTLTVKGSILAIGSTTDSICFSINDTTGFSDTLANSGGWHGFVYEHLEANADSSIFGYCIFEYGKALSTGKHLRPTLLVSMEEHSEYSISAGSLFETALSVEIWPSGGEGPSLQRIPI